MASKKKRNDKDLHGEAEKSKIFSDVIIENNKKNRRAEEVIEEKIVATIYETIHTRKEAHYGIRWNYSASEQDRHTLP